MYQNVKYPGQSSASSKVTHTDRHTRELTRPTAFTGPLKRSAKTGNISFFSQVYSILGHC